MATQVAQQSEQGEHEHRILIADDNAANRELLEAYLASVDCSVETAIDGQDTLDKTLSFRPDLILLDVMMPKLSGFEVCKKIRENPQTSRVMILMVTALNELGDIERGVAAGTDDFLSKPINKVELLKRVDNMLKLKGTADELERLRAYIREMEDQVEPRRPGDEPEFSDEADAGDQPKADDDSETPRNPDMPGGR